MMAPALCLVLALVAAEGDTQFANDARGFTLVVPSGFVRNDNLADRIPDWIAGFVNGATDSGQIPIVLWFTDMRKPLAEERIPPEVVQRSKARLLTTTWQGHTLDMIEVPEVVQGRETLTINVQVPIKRQGIQVSIAGPSERSAELHSHLASVLGSLRGESNWRGTSGFTQSRAYSILLANLCFVFAVASWISMIRYSRRASRWSVLGIALVLWSVGLISRVPETRELRLLLALVSAIGFGCLLIWVFRIVRPYRPPRESTT